jgi:hypothetical protein
MGEFLRMLRDALGFGTYTNCRCCKVTLTDRTGNVGCADLGGGFCHRCLAAILRKP